MAIHVWYISLLFCWLADVYMKNGRIVNGEKDYLVETTLCITSATSRLFGRTVNLVETGEETNTYYFLADDDDDDDAS